MKSIASFGKQTQRLITLEQVTTKQNVVLNLQTKIWLSLISPRLLKLLLLTLLMKSKIHWEDLNIKVGKVNANRDQNHHQDGARAQEVIWVSREIQTHRSYVKQDVMKIMIVWHINGMVAVTVAHWRLDGMEIIHSGVQVILAGTAGCL